MNTIPKSHWAYGLWAMAWLLKCIQAGSQQGITLPMAETDYWTNFNR